MSYLGKTQLKSSDIQRFDVTSSTSATHVLSWTAPNEQSLIITINGVKQQDDAYSIAGSPTTVTLTDALITTDKLEIVGIVDVGTMNVPGVGSVQTDQLADDAVTADKLANSINTEIAANTAKVTNATHTGDVTGATALTIAADAVDIAMLSATGTADATTFLRGDNSWAAASYTNPNTVSGCHVTLSGNQSIAGSSYVKVLLDTETWDLDDEFASNKFTVKTAGRYFIIVQTHMADMAADQKLQNFIYKNGSDACNARNNTSSAGGLTAITATVLILAVDDYIESYVYNGDSTARDATAGYNGTYMMIQRVT